MHTRWSFYSILSVGLAVFGAIGLPGGAGAQAQATAVGPAQPSGPRPLPPCFAQIEKFANNHDTPQRQFLEGGGFDTEGNFWFVGIGSGWISYLTPDGKLVRVADCKAPDDGQQLTPGSSRDEATSAQTRDVDATEQLTALRARINQLEEQLKQRSSRDDSASAEKRAEELAAQLADSTTQLKASQSRIGQLEAQLKQVASRDDESSVHREAERFKTQLAQATEELKASRARVSQLEAQLKRAPVQNDSDTARKPVADSQISLSAADASGGDLALLLDRGDSLFAVRDISSARLFYERAAEAGSAQAALRLGETYDPALLARAQLRVQGNTERAVSWYRRARELGAAEAEILLNSIRAP